MTETRNIRPAVQNDVDQLMEIETACFETDRLSRRSFMNFVRQGPHDLLVLAEEDKVLGYVLNLYRSGTNLARMYSIAIAPDEQGKGLSQYLLDAAEQAAIARNCVFIRLEVNIDNKAARNLYEKSHYKTIDRISEYYEDGTDALRMEKRIHREIDGMESPQPYYQQTTDFTCGPASLMMAMKSMTPDYELSRTEELQIWREATTIFMTSGHGGCSPHGMALSAWKRGYDVDLYINYNEAPFIDSVRNEEKKAVIQLVHDDFLDHIRQTSIKLNVQDIDNAQLDKIINTGLPVIALISTWQLNRNKAPHWVFITGSDKEFVYINDPDVDTDAGLHLTQTDYKHVPVLRSLFYSMAQFGQKRLRCLLVLSKR
ncbi:MAG: GNAT family N-acetyltransferase/peptidase C39 family protein [Gammaproteobacteria bacterium]|nr:GNAT family N-acetyltransferase/peptidase C39 family protein [Gammaproteobacteria bacterium]MDH5592770.1 GNAT family N-acetyltransferase/peptidase C39 family protein [Gammaproteobacteria bacterium]